MRTGGFCAHRHKVISQIISEKGEINIIFAAAPSQNEMLENLLSSSCIDWSKVNALHMDEYVGLPEGDPHTFGSYLYAHIFGHKPFKSVHYIRGSAADTEAECLRYAQILAQCPADVVCLGIGENGHIAFNDPWVAKFQDAKAVKIVELGWDAEFGGLYHFVPCDGLNTKYTVGEAADEPQMRLVLDDWGSKLWWVHSEAMYTTLLMYCRTGNVLLIIELLEDRRRNKE